MSKIPPGKVRESWSYGGEVWTDANGHAVVVLPPFLRAHRTGFAHELAPVGSPCSATVAEDIVGERFIIATYRRTWKVEWRVTALREQCADQLKRHQSEAADRPIVAARQRNIGLSAPKAGATHLQHQVRGC